MLSQYISQSELYPAARELFALSCVYISMDASIAAEGIERRIWLIRGQRVMLDSDLAEIYCVPTKRLNEQVKRNLDRFPADFMFRLSEAGTTALLASRSQSATLKRGQNIKHRPYAFSEHGAVMLATVLSSPVAVHGSIQVVRAFVRLRRMALKRRETAIRLDRLEREVASHGEDIQNLFETIRQLMNPPRRRARQIGFQRN